MDDNQELKVKESQAIPPGKGRFLGWPQTRMGWWAVGLAIASLTVPLLTGMINLVMRMFSTGEASGIGMFGLFMLLFSIAGGIMGVIAVVWKHERSILVWFAILIGVGALALAGRDIILALL